MKENYITQRWEKTSLWLQFTIEIGKIAFDPGT